jgi:WD40 repeat protein
VFMRNIKVSFTRNLQDPRLSKIYSEHTCNATVAVYSPTGNYIASGDVQGNVRIWDALQDTHSLKYAAKILSGRINDISWDSESARLMVGGIGFDKYSNQLN